MASRGDWEGEEASIDRILFLSLSLTLRGRKVQRVVNNRLHGVECQLRFNHRGSIGRETGRDITGRRETPPRFDGQG